jgi:hypothetical protein
MGTPEFVGAAWRTSSRSDGARACVEVAVVLGLVGVRDSRDRSGPALVVTPSGWQAFLRDVQLGGFDHG